MCSEKQKYNRSWITNEVLKELSCLVEKDPFMEAVSIWIRFKNKGIDVPVYYKKFIKAFSDRGTIKMTIGSALDFIKREHKKDNSLNMVNIVLKNKIDTSRLGHIIIVDISSKQ